jgi:hypothetical protein
MDLTYLAVASSDIFKRAGNMNARMPILNTKNENYISFIKRTAYPKHNSCLT